jgi:hypothetical protein
MYDTRRDVRVEGVVTQFEFINPHAFITLEVRETGRAPRQWRELDDRGELSDIGMTAQTLRPGDTKDRQRSADESVNRTSTRRIY